MQRKEAKIREQKRQVAKQEDREQYMVMVEKIEAELREFVKKKEIERKKREEDRNRYIQLMKKNSTTDSTEALDRAMAFLLRSYMERSFFV